MRVNALVGLHSVLPGYLFAQFRDVPAVVEQLPQAQIPEPLRSQDPGLRDAPLVRVPWRECVLSIGQRSFAVSNAAPYIGWPAFKARITELFLAVLGSGFVTKVDRYSIKYVNFFEIGKEPNGADALNWDLRIGPIKVSAHNAQLRAEVEDGEFLNILNIASSATVQVSGSAVRTGAVLDIDTICKQVAKSPEEFSDQLSALLDDIRRRNKVIFFASLRDEAIAAMEPKYGDA